MKFYPFFAVLIITFFSCQNKSVDRNLSGKENNKTYSSKNNQEFNLNEYSEFSKFEGDLNGDKEIDKIVVYEKKCDSLIDKDYVENAKCRRIAIYLKNKTEYKLYGYNDKLIDCSECGGAGTGDPFQSIKIKNGYFSIESLFGACDKTFIVTTFKFDNKTNDFYLYKIGTEDYSCNSQNNLNDEIKIERQTKTVKDFGKVKFVDYK